MWKGKGKVFLFGLQLSNKLRGFCVFLPHHYPPPWSSQQYSFPLPWSRLLPFGLWWNSLRPRQRGGGMRLEALGWVISKCSWLSWAPILPYLSVACLQSIQLLLSSERTAVTLMQSPALEKRCSCITSQTKKAANLQLSVSSNSSSVVNVWQSKAECLPWPSSAPLPSFYDGPWGIFGPTVVKG